MIKYNIILLIILSALIIEVKNEFHWKINFKFLNSMSSS